jgi:eukaryotic-like serine/threonine-protein kinase
MNKNQLYIPFFLLLSVLFLSACGGTGTSTSWPGLSVDQDRAYLAYNQFVYAIELQSGGQIWRFPAEKAESNVTFYAPPVLTPEGNLIIGSFTQNGQKSRLYSLDAATGTVKGIFEQAANNYIASPLVTEQGIYAPNADGVLYALDSDLNLRWKYPTSRAIWASPTSNETCDCVFVASMDHSLYSIDARTGTLKWKSADLGGALAGSPTFGSNGLLFIGTSGNQMMALNAQDGSIIWVYNTSGWIWSGAALHDGNLYFGDLQGNLVALKAETGVELWTVKADGAILTKPLVFNDQIYYTTENNFVYAVDLNGNPTWRQEMSAKVYAPAVAAEDLILIALTDQKAPLAAYDLNGKLLWTFSLASD